MPRSTPSDVCHDMFDMRAELQTNAGDKWMSFKLERYFSPQSPALVGHTNKQMKALNYSKKIEFKNNPAEMLIKDLPCMSLVNEGIDSTMRERILLRYLTQICWFPSAALNNFITWEAIDSLQQKPQINYMGATISGVFQFKENGDIVKFFSKSFLWHWTKQNIRKMARRNDGIQRV